MLDMADRGMSDEVLNCVMPYIHDPKDRDAVSLVCRRWYELDALTRKHITIALCYTTTPGRLRGRFPHLESLKLKGKPRAAMFNLIMEDWGGYVTPWVKEISDYFDCLKSLHFRRMIVKDSDLQLLAQARGRVLLVLKLDKCSGFSTDGLLHVGRSCRQFWLHIGFDYSLLIKLYCLIECQVRNVGFFRNIEFSFCHVCLWFLYVGSLWVFLIVAHCFMDFKEVHREECS